MALSEGKTFKRSLLFLWFIAIGASLSPADHAQVRSGGEIEGIWLGTLKFDGAELRVTFTITKDQDNTLTATMDVPEQNATDIPVDDVVFSDGNVRLELISIEGVFEGRLSEDGETIEGMWTQGSMTLTLVLQRTEEELVLERPQEPKEPFPYTAEEVIFENTEAGITFAGMLTLPESGEDFPAVLLLSGSGPQDRDEAAFGHRPFLVLADDLTRKGIAVLRVDDRGVGGSTGHFDGATALDFTEDAMAGVAYIKRRDEIDTDRIGLIGHSEGGMIAPLVAVRSPDVAFIVLIASPGLPIKQMEYSDRARSLKARGASDGLIARNRCLQKSLFTVIEQETDGPIVRDAFTALITDFSKGLQADEKDIMGISEETLNAYIENQFQRLHSPWFRFYLPYDPGMVLRKVNCPVLAINGEKDVQVPSKENLAAIVKTLEAGGNSNYTIKELSHLNHLLQTAETGNISEYGKIEETMSPTALHLIGNWILEQTARR